MSTGNSTCDTNTTTTTTAMTTSTASHMVPSPSFYASPSMSACNTCRVRFQAADLQRAHMKESWHIYNVKRRVVDMPPVSRQVYDQHISQSTATENDSEEEYEETSGCKPRPRRENPRNLVSSACLFCESPDAAGDDHEAGSERLLRHMQRTHGFIIPDLDRLVDLESLLDYLRLVVFSYHDCMCCDVSRSSTRAIRQHMVDSGHCRLNFAYEPELLDFWDHTMERSGSEAPANMNRAFGTTSRPGNLARPKAAAASQARKLRRTRQSRGLEPCETTEDEHVQRDTIEAPSGNKEARLHGLEARQLSRSSELGMVGITQQQRQALVATEKKWERSAQTQRKQFEWAKARMVNHQKYYRTQGPERPLG